MKREFKGVWIPAEIWLSKNLSIQEKVLLAEIDSLQHPDRGCFKSNSRLGEYLGLSASRVSHIVSGLTSKGFISVDQIMDGNRCIERRIFTSRGIAKTQGGIAKTQGGYCGSSYESNTPNSNTVESDRSDDPSIPQDLVKNGFDHFWKTWKEAKKSCGKLDTSPKGDTYNKKWKPLFNRAYWLKHTEQDFREKVNQICKFVVEAHEIDGFNRFENMQTGRFFTEKQWEDA